MLDPEAPSERRVEIVDDVRRRIESKGTLKRADDWGVRKMAYEIRHHPEADYRLFQFEADGPLLDELSHSLKIADGVLRFRTVRLDPGMPPAPEMSPPPAPPEQETVPEGSPQPEPPPDVAPADEAEVPAEPEVPSEPEVPAEALAPPPPDEAPEPPDETPVAS